MKTTTLHGMALASLAPLALISSALAAGSLIVVTGSGSAEMQPDRVTITAAPPRAFESRLQAGTISTGTLPSITPGPITVTVTVLGRWGFVERK